MAAGVKGGREASKAVPQGASQLGWGAGRRGGKKHKKVLESGKLFGEVRTSYSKNVRNEEVETKKENNIKQKKSWCATRAQVF
jgi:hypothetical protein